ncbi:hypothetical protein [Streptomyces sp. HF10]|uniref:hypothetical protein n=1 Tax=Streptomyces sp. HF10 TaxID=2692233 RepID=UPI001F16DB32|nr:hypothetical protein [Streptomyces sp. HF10]
MDTVQTALDATEGSKSLLGGTDQMSLLIQRRYWELDGLQARATEVCEVRRDPHFSHEATSVEMTAKDQKRPAGQHVAACPEAQQAVGEGDPFGDSSIHGGAADEVGALAFIQQNVTRLQAVFAEDP